MQLDPEQKTADLSTDEIHLEEFIGDMEALQYAGFDPAKTREIVRSRLDTKMIGIAIISYLVAGNNLEKLDVKRMDEEHGRRIKTMLREVGIANKGTRLSSTETLTLSRIAMAFSPLVFLMRLYFREKLQRRATVSLDVVYQDISLANISRELNFPSQYEDYLNWFGEAINPGAKNQDMFVELARVNSERDSYYHGACELIKESGLDHVNPDLELVNSLANRILSMQM